MRVLISIAAILLSLVNSLGAVPSAGAAAGPYWTIDHSGSTNTLNDISCTSPRACFVVGEHGTVLRTYDGGASWNSAQSQLVGHDLTSIRCGKQSHCEVVAPPATIFITTNGGASWTSHTFKLPKSFSHLGRVACPTPLECFVTVSPSGSPDTWYNRSPAIYRTTNGGAGWKRLSIPSNIGCPGECTNRRYQWGYDLQWIACVSAKVCRAGGNTFLGEHIGFASAVIATKNGGQSWHFVHRGFDPTAAACSSASICAGIRYQPDTPNIGPDFQRTTNGGTSWSTKSSFHPLLTAIACSGRTFCQLVGPHGRTAQASGLTLHPQKKVVGADLSAVSCPSPAACFAAGAHGTIIAWK